MTRPFDSCVHRDAAGVLDGGRPVLFDEGEHAEDAPDADGPVASMSLRQVGEVAAGNVLERP